MDAWLDFHGYSTLLARTLNPNWGMGAPGWFVGWILQIEPIKSAFFCPIEGVYNLSRRLSSACFFSARPVADGARRASSAGLPEKTT